MRRNDPLRHNLPMSGKDILVISHAEISNLMDVPEFASRCRAIPPTFVRTPIARSVAPAESS